MIGFLLYIVALFMLLTIPSNIWIVPLLFGMLFHWKMWLTGIAAFFVGAGFNKNF